MSCFTATAKPRVISDIQKYFKDKVYWKNENDEKEIKILLPEIYFENMQLNGVLLKE